MKRLLPILSVLVLILSGCQTTGGNDKDWNVHFYDNCGMPKNAMRWIQDGENKFVRFQLRDKDYGGCSSDRIRRHSAPYWERAELKQSSTLDWDSAYELEFNVRFVKGFTGDRETFWQMHAYNSPCNASPPLMIKFSEGRLLFAALGEGGTGHVNYYSNLKINDVVGKWNVFKIKFNTFFKSKFDTSKTAKISLFVNGNEIIPSVPYGMKTCGTPHFKFGIYRPGSLAGNNLSVADFDKIKLTRRETKFSKIKLEESHYCFNENGPNSNIEVYSVSGNCKEGHESISPDKYFRIKELLEEWKKEDESKQQSN